MSIDANTADRLFAEYIEGVVEGVWRSCEDLLSRSVQGAPVDEGTLRASAAIVVRVGSVECSTKAAAIATAKAAGRQGRDVEIAGEVSFNTQYAARQHEELGWRHPKGGAAKYLERPLLEQSARYTQIISDSAEVALRRAST